jgi:hypothetical protein
MKVETIKTLVISFLFLSFLSFVGYAILSVRGLSRQVESLKEDIVFYEDYMIDRDVHYGLQSEDFSRQLYKRSEQISVLEQSIDPKNMRWARIKSIRKVIQKIAHDKGKKLSIAELTQIASSTVDASEQFDIDTTLILAIITQESAFDSKAVSYRHAKGLMQLMDRTAKECADDIGKRYYDVFKVHDNIQLGTWYLWKMLNHFNLNLELAIKAYNCGPTCVEKVLAGEWKNGYPEETKDYVVQVLKYKSMYENLGL